MRIAIVGAGLSGRLLALNLGLRASSVVHVRMIDRAVSGVLHTIGSPMKGVLWEVLAVPDIRVQAERLARRLLEGEP